MIWKLVISALLTVCVCKLGFALYHRLTSPLRALPGPNATSLIYGNLKGTYNPENSELALQERWVKEYGTTILYKGFFNSNTLFTTDVRAVNHILTHGYDYEKPAVVRYLLCKILGPGVLLVEGAHHRQQRRIINPAFGPGQIRELTDVFLSKSIKLRGVLSSTVAASEPYTRIDIMSWLSRMTLDVIGLAGFNYEFDALSANEKPSELQTAFSTIFTATQKIGILDVLKTYIPFFRWIHSDRDRVIAGAQETMGRIGRQLLNDSKAAIMSLEEGELVEKNSSQGRDLLSLLVRANMATDISESQRLSDEDVLAQVPTFLVAGHETTSTATTWALFALCLHPELQTKLREELETVQTETPSMEELMALPYLDAVVRETLRVYAPVANALRVAMKDDIIPVENPYKDKYGAVCDVIKIRKGDYVTIPIQAMNKSEAIWGTDAEEFNPERWTSPPDAASRIPGVWGHLMSFLGGPRACIGYRFSLVEMKALLFTLIKAFEFELAVPASDIGRRVTVVQRPMLLSDPEHKCQLPLLMKPYRRV